jgi:hypothetical protein
VLEEAMDSASRNNRSNISTNTVSRRRMNRQSRSQTAEVSPFTERNRITGILGDAFNIVRRPTLS